jgi:hypothetical protein
MIFDQKMTSLIRSGRFDAAKNLLIRKYPHLKEDSDRIAMYIRRYQFCENLRLMLQ